MSDNFFTPIEQAEEEQLQRNLEAVLARLNAARERAGRKPEELRLVAVSKRHSLPRILSVARHWAALGGRPLFGENYLQEAQAKQTGLADLGSTAPQLDWHFIGHLQSNKAKQAIGSFELIHTLDSLSLARNLQKVLQAELGGVKKAQTAAFQPVLVQVNIAAEPSKSGVLPEDLADFLQVLQGIDAIQVQGLMILPPFSENPEETRPYFIRLRQMRDRLERELGIKLPHLSMGMSHDFEAAVEEGATLVRVGTDIFGQRQY